jgi:methionine-R-sulfoxide reductase
MKQRNVSSFRGLLALTLMIVVAAGAAAQRQPESWMAAHDTVERLISDVSYQGEPLATMVDEYDPEARIIHPDDADIDYPVQLSEQEWRNRLSSMEYYILREEGTERPYSGELNDEKRRGIYYSAATGQPLFHSDDKYDSGTGWPSFTKPISPEAVAYLWDTGLFSRRIEVVDSLTGSHLGHVFSDGPAPTGQRYCMNSAAMVFVPEGGDPPPLLTGN